MKTIYLSLIVSLSFLISSFSYANEVATNKLPPGPICYQFAATTFMNYIFSDTYETYRANDQFVITSFAMFQSLSKDINEHIEDIDPSFLKLDESIIVDTEIQQAKYDAYLRDMRRFVSHIDTIKNDHGSVAFKYLKHFVTKNCVELSKLLTQTEVENKQVNPKFINMILNTLLTLQQTIYIGLIIDFNPDNKVIKIDTKKFPMLRSMFSDRAEIYKKPKLKN